MYVTPLTRALVFWSIVVLTGVSSSSFGRSIRSGIFVLVRLCDSDFPLSSELPGFLLVVARFAMVLWRGAALFSFLGSNRLTVDIVPALLTRQGLNIAHLGRAPPLRLYNALHWRFCT